MSYPLARFWLTANFQLLTFNLKLPTLSCAFRLQPLWLVFWVFFYKRNRHVRSGVMPLIRVSIDTCSRKEVFQPHLPVRLPCYDLAPVTGFTLGRSLRLRTSGTPSFHGLTGGVYKARERIHRSIADLRLLANPTSRGRVADPDPNCEQLFEIGILLPGSCPLYCPL